MLVSQPLLSFEDAKGDRTEIGCVYDDATRAISEVWAHHRGDTAPVVRVFTAARGGESTLLTLEKDVQRTTSVAVRGYTMRAVEEPDGPTLIFPLCLQVVHDNTREAR